MVTVYEGLAPDEGQLRAALAALALPVPAEIESLDEGPRAAALAGHLLRASTRATHSLVTASTRGEAGRRARAVCPRGWPVAEDHWTTARIELEWTAARMNLLLDDQHAAGAVTMDTPGAEPNDYGGVEQVEAHAAGAEGAIEAAINLISLRLAPSDRDLTDKTLALIGDCIGQLTDAHQALMLVSPVPQPG